MVYANNRKKRPFGIGGNVASTSAQQDDGDGGKGNDANGDADREGDDTDDEQDYERDEDSGVKFHQGDVDFETDDGEIELTSGHVDFKEEDGGEIEVSASDPDVDVDDLGDEAKVHVNDGDEWLRLRGGRRQRGRVRGFRRRRRL